MTRELGSEDVLPVVTGMMGDAPLSVRSAREADLDTLVDLLRDCVAAMRQAGIDQWDDIYPNRRVLLEDVRQGAMYIGFVDAVGPAGAIVLNERQDSEYAEVPWTIFAERIAVVHRLMVAPRWQRKGVARALMAFAEARACALGYGAIRLDAFTANTGALRLYHGVGYRDAGGITLRKGPFRCFEKRLD